VKCDWCGEPATKMVGETNSLLGCDGHAERFTRDTEPWAGWMATTTDITPPRRAGRSLGNLVTWTAEVLYLTAGALDAWAAHLLDRTDGE